MLDAYGVDRALLARRRRTGRSEPGVRRALAHLASHTYAVHREAEEGVAEPRPVSRPCVETALTLYRNVLDGIAAADYRVFSRRVVVPGTRRTAAALPGLARAAVARAVQPGTDQKARAWALRFTSRPRSPRSASMGVPGSVSSSVKSQRRISSVE